MNVLAYHITWGTYGTRLHGDPRGTVDRQNNEYGTPVPEYDEHRWIRETENLKFDPIYLTRDEMIFVESIIPSICECDYWKIIECAAGPDHVHTVLSSPNDPETIRRLLKRWLGQAMSEQFGLEKGRTWWAECGSIRWIDNERYFANAANYVHRQHATPRPQVSRRAPHAEFPESP